MMRRGYLACGCCPEEPCSLAELLFRFGQFRALKRHIEESYEQTFENRKRKLVSVERSRRNDVG